MASGGGRVGGAGGSDSGATETDCLGSRILVIHERQPEVAQRPIQTASMSGEEMVASTCVTTMQGRRLRLLAVLSLVCLLPLLSLIYTYRTFHPAVTRARRESASIAAAAPDSRAVSSSLFLDSTPDPIKVPETMSAKTAVENAISQRKNRTVVFSKVRLSRG